MVLKRAAALLLLGAPQLFSQTLRDRLDNAYERVMSKNGIDIGGHISSEYFHSSLSGPAAADTNYSYETTQFTSFDLDMQYRPYDFVGATTVLRFYQDWQTFFATRSRILAARWLSVDGNLGNMLGFNIGDFRQKYTPLTLWSPELETLYEPEIFARARAQLMAEQFLRDNDRILQGLNLNFARRFASPEARVDAVAARVRRGEFLDFNGAQGSGFSRSDMDRFFLAGNTEAFVLENVFLGGSYLALLDDRESLQLVALSSRVRAEVEATLPNGLDGRTLNNQNARDTLVARDLRVAGAHGGVDLAGFFSSPALTLELLGDFALSSESDRRAWHFKRDSAGNLQSSDAALPGTEGQAYTLELGAGYQPADSAYGFRLTATYLNNEAAFLNPMAQSPTFAGTRIMNTENDFAGATLYSTFDAQYNGVYKFTPSRATAAYQLAPFSKSSYGNGVYSPEDLASFAPDPWLQRALPFGLATPNRMGVKANLSGQWANMVHATLQAALLEEPENVRSDSLVFPKSTYRQTGAGLRLELGRFVGGRPLDLSASFSRSEDTRDPLPSDLATPEIVADMLMAGFYWRFQEKWAVLGGYQLGKLTGPRYLYLAASPAVQQFNQDQTQTHFRTGIEYTLRNFASLQVTGGMIRVERSFVHRGSPQNGDPANPALDFTSEFSQLISQALINVRF